MSQNLIVVADLLRFKLFASKKDPMGREYVELLESSDNIDIHQRFDEKISDKHGNFKGVGASGAGEDHNLTTEWERRRVKEIGGQISSVLHKHRHDSWYFAAPKAINNQILDLLDANEKKNMKINLPSDLTKIPNNKLLDHFSK